MAITITGSTTNIPEAAAGAVTITLDPGSRVIGVGGQAQLAATGGTAPYAFELVSGKLPPGLGFRSDGLFVGIPTVRGTFRLVVRAIDSSAPQQAVDMHITVVVA